MLQGEHEKKNIHFWEVYHGVANTSILYQSASMNDRCSTSDPGPGTRKAGGKWFRSLGLTQTVRAIWEETRRGKILFLPLPPQFPNKKNFFKKDIYQQFLQTSMCVQFKTQNVYGKLHGKGKKIRTYKMTIHSSIQPLQKCILLKACKYFI